jgi:hypothetical protein
MANKNAQKREVKKPAKKKSDKKNLVDMNHAAFTFGKETTKQQ